MGICRKLRHLFKSTPVECCSDLHKEAEVVPDYEHILDKLHEIGFLLDEIYELMGK